jgi:flagellar biosynthesis protein FlhB
MSSDKTEEPTPQRLRKARQQGDVAVSAALTQNGAFLGTLVIVPSALAALAHAFTRDVQLAIEGQSGSSWQWASRVLLLAVPVVAAGAACAALTGFVQTGGLFAPGRLAPKLDNANPFTGFARLFSLDRVWSTLRALLTASFVAWLALCLLQNHAASLVATVGEPAVGAHLAGELCKRLLWTCAAVGAALAFIDLLITRKSWFKRNRMSKDEIKREYRESEGDPQIKQERHRAHQEMLNSASVLAVKDASVLIVNPTHLACALRYDRDGDGAPEVLAQGDGALALRMIDAARAYGVPVVRDIPIAHALKLLAVGDEIPEELYEAVAEILREVWTQNEQSADGGQAT